MAIYKAVAIKAYRQGEANEHIVHHNIEEIGIYKPVISCCIGSVHRSCHKHGKAWLPLDEQSLCASILTLKLSHNNIFFTTSQA